jgi:hypothetical protein
MLKAYRRMAFHPERYQGKNRKKRYFEGWYFKIVDPQRKLAYALIPGVSMEENGERHAFIQVLDGVHSKSAYHRFAFEEFSAAPDRFEVRIGNNIFSDREVKVVLGEQRFSWTNKVAMSWPSSTLAPGVMGPFSYLPKMQCYHGLVSLHHRCVGQITDQRGTHSLSKGAIGYIEKDWGRSFPNAWVWLQSNHLTNISTPNSLMISVADIPLLGTSFVGFLCTFLFEGKVHTLATWTGAKHRLIFQPGEVRIELSDRKRKLVVTGRPAAGGNLASPIQGAMTGKINESLLAKLEVVFYLNGKLQYQGEANWAGLEVTDNAQRVLGKSS